MTHKTDCRWNYVSRHYDAVGVDVYSCYGCDAREYGPIEFKKCGYLGALSRWPEGSIPPGHESGLLEFPNCYSLDCTYLKPARLDLPILRTPVRLAFDPVDAIHRDKGKGEDGVTFADVWADPLARTIWLGFRGFLLASQYFRSGCIERAAALRKDPLRMLEERVYLEPESGSGLGGDSDGLQALSAQVVPYLIYELNQEARWPAFLLPGIGPLTWCAMKCARPEPEAKTETTPELTGAAAVVRTSTAEKPQD